MSENMRNFRFLVGILSRGICLLVSSVMCSYVIPIHRL